MHGFYPCHETLMQHATGSINLGGEIESSSCPINEPTERQKRMFSAGNAGVVRGEIRA
jgi:hypothetical protein